MMSLRISFFAARSVNAGAGPVAAPAPAETVSPVTRRTSSPIAARSLSSETSPIAATWSSVASLPTVLRSTGLRSLANFGDQPARNSSRKG